MSKSNFVRGHDASVDIRPTSRVQRADTSFGHAMRRGVSGSVSTVTGAGFLPPGAAVVAAALQQVGTLADSGGAGWGTPGAAHLGGSDAARGGVGPMSPEELLRANRELQAQNQTFNIQMLSAQEELQAHSRIYSMKSNIMKTRHESLRNTISNLR